MKKRKKEHRFKSWTPRQSPQPRTIELEPGDLAAYVRRAEKDVLPIIKERQLGPAAAQFLLAQQTQTLVTSDPRFSVESAMVIANTVLSLWETGYYTPSSAYPYTLEETMRELQEASHAKGDYAQFFLPLTPSTGDTPRGLGIVYGGIVKHPETNLWQIWMTIGGPCTFIAAYRHPVNALRNLAAIVNASRRGGTVRESENLYRRVLAQADGKPKQLPHDMMQYLVKHLDRYKIEL
ncbi:MAG TPA: hypothetical protein VFA09_24660 [Ktedonobacteraceae bacterium]|jgi:hypothetical protein|nr:hypothetical protein [Ktedonobacteraceae bacterium]